MDSQLLLATAALFLAATVLWVCLRQPPSLHRRNGRRIEPAKPLWIHRRKPEWVPRQLVLIKAHLPHAGCRHIADAFNHQFAHRHVSVSKSFVYRVLVLHAAAVIEARRAMRAAAPRPTALNHCWGLDLTGRADESGQVHTILGVIDHGSRFAVRVRRIGSKNGWSLLGHLCLAIADFGRPRFLRTDNESCFTGKVFTTGLRLLGIRHQLSELHCPWQNGRIERLFGTLKGVLKQLTLGNAKDFDAFLGDFSTWYNRLRPHQALGGATPAQAWAGIDPYHAPSAPKEIRFVEGWHGRLAGFWIRR